MAQIFPVAALPPPIHQYTFSGEGEVGAQLTDSVGNAHGVIVSKAKPKLPYHPGSATLVVIPDTEGYCMKRPQVFSGMMEWVAENQERRNIRSVLHVGDVTNDNLDVEWKNARKAFDHIEGEIPYVLAAGNHDYDHTPGRLTYMNKYFKATEQKKWSNFGEVFEEGKLENHYQFVEIHGQKWIVLSLEMGPRKAVVEWANKVLEKHPDHLAIVLTHGYLYYGTERYDHRKGSQQATPYNFYGEGADGEMLWKQLVSKHANVMMVICGHLSSQYVGYRKDKGIHGNLVHQMLVDYEKLKGGGGGFLRLLEFLPDGKTVQVRTYSPISKEIRSPVTKGEKPIQKPELEEFVFTLQAAPGREKLLKVNRSKKAPQVLEDENVDPVKARLNGKGQMVIEANDATEFGKLDAGLVKGRSELSLEAWVTPTSSSYNWSSVFRFDGGNDAIYYTFRTLERHRAEMIRNGHNEKIQRDIAVKVAKPLHIVMTYDEDGRDGKPLMCSYIDGKLTGEFVTGIKLSELALTNGRIGPFAGIYEEFRIYDVPLTAAQVRESFQVGPSKPKR